MNKIIDSFGQHHRVTDESRPDPVSPAMSDQSLMYVMPMFCGKGRSGEILLCEGHALASQQFGDYDNRRKYGDLGYMVRNYFKAGVKQYLCRLTAENAVKASMVVYLSVKSVNDIQKYKKSATNPAVYDRDENGDLIPEGTPNVSGLETKITVKAANDVSDYKREIPANWAVTTDNGWTNYPLFMVIAKGDGEDGNRYGITVAIDGTEDIYAVDGRRYKMGIVYNDQRLGPISYGTSSDVLYFSLNPEATKENKGEKP